MTIKKKLAQQLAVGAGLLTLSAGAAYAAFTSNTVSFTGNRLTTGSAAVKLCDVDGQNAWTENITPEFDLAAMMPGEERDLLGDREIYIGNDNAELANNFTDARCGEYLADRGNSVAPLRITPNVAMTSETCPDPLQSYVKLRFEINGVDTDYKTLNGWASNASQFAEFQPGQMGTIKAFAQLSSTTSQQEGSCDFAITFTGKQPTS